jgi:carboxymethylenebutenolidase
MEAAALAARGVNFANADRHLLIVLRTRDWYRIVRANFRDAKDLKAGRDKMQRRTLFMTTQDSPSEAVAVPAVNPNEISDLGALFDGHIAREFVDFDVDATMKTMAPEPYVHCVPIMTGGSGGQGVRRFYSEHFINQIPKDAKVTPISRTVGKDQVVDELIVSFTHNTQWDYLLPGIPPTGKRVELPHVVVMKFENGKVAHEHVWWDQASLLVQVGLLDPARLPVAGVEQARKLLRLAQKLSLTT